MTHQASPLDRRALMERVEGDLDLLVAIIDAYLTRLPETLSSIEASIRAKDGVGLSQAAHALKGSTANFSTGRVYQISSGLETAGNAGSWAGAEAELASLEAAARELDLNLREIAEEARTGHVQEDD